MLHAGIGPPHVNALFTSINLPPVSKNILKVREREIGPAIESVAKKSCEEAIEIEKRFWSSEENSGAETINIGVSYDMGWQKRGKGHNSLTGNCCYIYVTAYNILPDLRL